MFGRLKEELLELIRQKVERLQKDTGDYGGNAFESSIDQIDAARNTQKIERLQKLRREVIEGTISLGEIRELLR